VVAERCSSVKPRTRILHGIAGSVIAVELLDASHSGCLDPVPLCARSPQACQFVTLRDSESGRVGREAMERKRTE
jgi:hypothetical protein